MRFVVGALIAAVMLTVVVALWVQWNGNRKSVMQFSGQDAVLEEAIVADDPAAVNSALAGGANVNARGAVGVTPLAFAVGTGKQAAARALIASGANPNIEDDEGDTAVTLAVNTYARQPDLLPMILDAGGNPNQLRPDGDPVIVRFINGANLDAITLMQSKGADMSAIANQQPLVVFAAYGTDWDVVWHLITLGADLTDPKAREGLVEAFKVPGATLPDSPLYPAKVKVYERLRELGEEPVPPAEYEGS
ncbi:ankyrin repeat domain-containing protein [uncultured Erythrobacter sp.]|uniref:ankyrin repeat domain-containing protein n=1 Tax=uncultured Erythrobacter sp. TaxID=263913 RepID=UPI0026235E36|nr:ankyrin repeat domain-containing protein [uncultured Erythrobacter sp.]